MVRNLPSSAGDVGSIPGWGTKIPCALGKLSPSATTREVYTPNREPIHCKKDPGQQESKNTPLLPGWASIMEVFQSSPGDPSVQQSLRDSCLAQSVWSFLRCHRGLFIDCSFPGGSNSKESACSARDPVSVPGSGRSPGEGNSNQLQYSCLENSMDRGAWQATVHGVTKSHTTEQLWSYPFTAKDEIQV